MVETGFPGRTLGGAASAAGISSHGDGLLVLLDVLEEGNSALEFPAVDGLGGLASVLERHSEVGTASAGRLRGLDLGRGVSNLDIRKRDRRSVCLHVFKSRGLCHHHPPRCRTALQRCTVLSMSRQQCQFLSNLIISSSFKHPLGQIKRSMRGQALTISTAYGVVTDSTTWVRGLKLRNSNFCPKALAGNHTMFAYPFGKC